MAVSEVGTLIELDVKPGDMVEVIGGRQFLVKGVDVKGVYCFDKVAPYLANDLPFRIISRASYTPKLWRDMTDAEKGALLLAKHDGEVIEYQSFLDIWKEGGLFLDGCAYRIRPEPKVETVTVTVRGGQSKLSGNFFFGPKNCSEDTHCITFTTIDGKPDTASIKMEAI